MRGMPRLNSDTYALGMTAIQLLTKDPPREFIRDDRDRVIAPNTRIAPAWLVDILNKMVRTDFQERYQSVEEVLKDLGQRNNRQDLARSLPKDNHNLVETKQINYQRESTANKVVPPSKSGKKLLYLSLIFIPLLLIIGSEAIEPWIRPWYYLREANSLLDRNQPQDSLGKFQQAIDLQRDSAAAWKGRGDALFTLGRYSGALTAYNKAIALEPDNAKALNNKGKILKIPPCGAIADLSCCS